MDVRGKRDEPIARLTPLGWSCVGILEEDHKFQQTNFNRTYFSSATDRELEEVDSMLRKFREIEIVPAVTKEP